MNSWVTAATAPVVVMVVMVVKVEMAKAKAALSVLTAEIAVVMEKMEKMVAAAAVTMTVTMTTDLVAALTQNLFVLSKVVTISKTKTLSSFGSQPSSSPALETSTSLPLPSTGPGMMRTSTAARQVSTVKLLQVAPQEKEM